MTLLYLDIENKVKGHPSFDGLLVVAYAVNDGPVKAVERGDFVADETNRFSPEAYEFLDLLQDPNVTKVEQSKHDYRFLGLAGAGPAGPIHDTTVMAHMLNENTPLDIDWLAWRYAGVDMDKRLHRASGRVMFRDDDGHEWDIDDTDNWPEDGHVWQQFVAYCIRDVDGLRALYKALKQRLQESEWWPFFLDERVPYTNVLVNMEQRGLPINVPKVEALAAELAPERDRIGAELVAEAGLPPSFNINSGDQLATYLFSRVVTFNDALVYDRETIECLKSCLDGEHEDCIFGKDGGFPSIDYAWDELHIVDLLPEGFTIDKLGRDRVHGHWTVRGRGLKETPPPRNKVTGEVGKRPSTSSPELLYMHAGDPWVRKLCLEYRKLDKLLSTYLTKWPVEAHNGRLYGRFNQTGTVTGRLSSSGPNLQNVPARGERGKQVRSLFEAPEGKLLVVGDYDQLEMRLMAHFSEDEQMLRIFRQGKDPHLITAQGIFGEDIDPHGEERGIGKTLNFAMGYGAGPKKVAQVLSLAGYPTTKGVAEGYLAEMSRFYRGFFSWKQRVMAKAKRTGNVVTIGGSRRRLRAAFKDTANWKLVQYGERQAVNAIIQGSAADIIRKVMVAVEPAFEELALLAQVHDELVWEVGDWHGDCTDMLAELQDAGQRWHNFPLVVPLVFEPHIGYTWAAAKEGEDLAALFDEVEGDE